MVLAGKVLCPDNRNQHTTIVLFSGTLFHEKIAEFEVQLTVGVCRTISQNADGWDVHFWWRDARSEWV